MDVLSDRARQLHSADASGRELLISCGAALFGLRLGMRTLGYLPAVELFPDRGRPDILARVRIAGRAPITRHESELVAAVHHRHTHRGPFTPGDVPPRLIAGMRMDAATEQAELIVLEDPAQVEYLAGLVLIAAREQAASAPLAAEMRGWARPAGLSERDGVPASAVARQPSATEAGEATPGRLPQRDFGVEGTADTGGAPPSVTAVLTTAGDTPADWIQAGQALHRMLLRAATRWVFASLQSQPLESPPRRSELRSRLGLTGAPQLVLQLGRANTAAATARRLATETLTPVRHGEP